MKRRLHDEGLLYSYTINQGLYKSGTYGNNLDISLGNYVNISATPVNYQPLTPEETTRNEKEELNDLYDADGVGTIPSSANRREMARNSAMGRLRSGLAFSGSGDKDDTLDTMLHLFFLGDLMEILLDCLYQDNTATHHTHTQDLNLRFIVGCIEVPDPKDATQTLVINPLQIPIDLAFFASWYNDTIVKKGIQSYAIGPFIKDLIERLVNDVLYDNCFSLLQIDEAPPQLRSTFLSDNSYSWFYTSEYKWSDTSEYWKQYNEGEVKEHWLDPEKPFGKIAGPPTDRLAIMKRDISAKPGSSHNYCIIYQQFPSFFRQKIGGNSDSQFKNSEYVPSLFDGYKSTTINYCANVSFSKVEIKFISSRSKIF